MIYQVSGKPVSAEQFPDVLQSRNIGGTVQGFVYDNGRICSCTFPSLEALEADLSKPALEPYKWPEGQSFPTERQRGIVNE